MPKYEYKARTKEGEIRTGVIDTSSEESVLGTLEQSGLTVISVKEKTKPGIFQIKIGGRIKNRDIVIFSRQMATLFEAHIPLTQALKTLMDETAKPALKSIIAEIFDDITGGMSLSQSLSKYPEAFSTFFVNLIKSGEESGKLQEVFLYLADYLERSYYLTNRAKNAMIYPAFILFAFVGVMIVMLVVVIPRLVGIFKETGQPIPIYTRAIILFSDILRQWGLGLLIVIIVAVVFLWRWGQTPKGRFFFHKLQLNIPVVGDLYKKLFMARLTDNLHTLIISGIPVIKSLTITGDIVGNAVYQKNVEEAIEAVKAGNTISSAFEKSRFIPSLVTQMIKIGETSGKLDFILANIARYYQKEVDSVVENLVALIEPVLIIFLGIGVGVIVGSVLVPLYNMVGNI